MKFEKKDLFYIIVIALLGFLVYSNHMSNNAMSDKFDKYEQTIAALNDSIHVNVVNGITEYSKLSPEMDINEFVKSEAFKGLTLDQQKYYLELASIRGLMAATSAELQKQGILLDQITQANNPGAVNKDSIGFKLGTVLNFSEKDSTKHLQWTSQLTLDTTIGFQMDYNYNVGIQTQFARQKDKSILVTYKVDDPDLKINSMDNFTIPAETKPTRFGRWYDKNRRTINCVAGGALFAAGGYAGYQLAR